MADELDLSEVYANFKEDTLQAAHDSIYEVLVERAKKLERMLKESTPVKTGALKGSLVNVTVQDTLDKVVIKVAFDGYSKTAKGNPGTAFQVIANSLNHGYFISKNSVFVAKHQGFIDRAIHECLSGMDEEIGIKFEYKMGS